MTSQSTGSLGKKVLSRESPAGRDVRDLECFLELQAEIDRARSISQTGSVDWKKVQDLSTDILDREGKDLLVACYLSVALTRNGGPPGFLEGLLVMKDLVEDYWETLYPPLKRIRGRRNALAWWIDVQKELLPALEGPALSPEEMEIARAAIRSLDRTLGEKDPEGPLPGSLAGLVGNLPVLDPEPPEQPEEAAAPEETPPPAPEEQKDAETAAGKPVLLSGNDPEESLALIYPALRDLSETLLISDPDDFRLYRYGRMAAWDPVLALPDSNDRVTRIPPPPHPILSAFETILESQNIADILEFCESRQKDYPFWLDLSCREAMALERSGGTGQKASLAIRSELTFLIQRLPGIESLAFSDNTPFLSPAGREWISRSGGSPPDSQERDRLSTSSLFEPIRQLIEEQRIEEAADRFEETRKNVSSGQLRFLLNAEFLGAVIGKGRDFPVEILAASLLREVDRIGLDHWDPALSKQVLSLIYRAFSQSEDPERKKEAGALMRRLVEIDLSTAVEVFRQRW